MFRILGHVLVGRVEHIVVLHGHTLWRMARKNNRLMSGYGKSTLP